MSRKSRDQRGQFRTMVRYDGRGRIIPGGNILKKGQKPQEGRWEAKEAYECCNASGLSYKVGDLLSDGIVTSVLGNDKYLVASLNNSGIPYIWAENALSVINVPGTTNTIGSGKINTNLIISTLPDGQGSVAARLVREQFGEEWNLPSSIEMDTICDNLSVLTSVPEFENMLSDRPYWTSNQPEQTVALYKYFQPGPSGIQCQQSSNGKSQQFNIRPMKIVDVSIPLPPVDPPLYNVGDSLFDGIVADVLPNNQFLLVALSDLTNVNSNQFFWDPTNPAPSVPGSTGVIIGTGKSNTDAIVNAGIDSASAGNQVRSQFGGSWNLPSQNEFLKICKNKLKLENNIAFTPLESGFDYWTSTQDVQQTGSAIKITFNPGNPNIPPFCDYMFDVQKNNSFKVRAMKIVDLNIP